MEAVQTVLWALGVVTVLPPYDTSADAERVLPHIPFEQAEAFLRSARLREPAELDRARATAELWHWRSRTRELIERGQTLPVDARMRAAGLTSFDDIVRFSARKAAEAGTIPPVVDDDFPVQGRAYRELDADAWSQVRSITMERHYAPNWLCGYAPGNDWDKTPTGT